MYIYTLWKSKIFVLLTLACRRISLKYFSSADIVIFACSYNGTMLFDSLVSTDPFNKIAKSSANKCLWQKIQVQAK